MRSSDLKLTASTTILWRRRRFRLRVFFVNMWLLLDLKQTNLPVPVRLKRLAAPLLVFSFGITSSRANFAFITSDSSLIKSLRCQSHSAKVLGKLIVQRDNRALLVRPHRQKSPACCLLREPRKLLIRVQQPAGFPASRRN